VGVPIVKQEVVGRTVILTFSIPPRSDNRVIYGNIRYGVQIKRIGNADPVHSPDVSCVGDTLWYEPNTKDDPHKNELAYRNEESRKWLISGAKYTQLLPLLGQSVNKNVNTKYCFRVRAENEAGESEPSEDIEVIALCTDIADIVHSHEHYKKLYVENLSVISADIGTITSGTLQSNIKAGETKPNVLLDLTNEEFRIGNEPSLEEADDEAAQYIHYRRINGAAHLAMKVANFILSSAASIIKGLFYVKSVMSDIASSFFVVNPTDEQDKITGVDAESASVNGALEIKSLRITKRKNVELLLHTDYGYLITSAGERIQIGILNNFGGNADIEGDVTVGGGINVGHNGGV